jgi:hypothetical protein
MQLQHLTGSSKGLTPTCFIIEQVASNKSSLLLKIQNQNTQTLQLFAKIIKTESIYKSNKMPKLGGNQVV